jgi:hypothetical protein
MPARCWQTSQRQLDSTSGECALQLTCIACRLMINGDLLHLCCNGVPQRTPCLPVCGVLYRVTSRIADQLQLSIDLL